MFFLKNCKICKIETYTSSQITFYSWPSLTPQKNQPVLCSVWSLIVFLTQYDSQVSRASFSMILSLLEIKSWSFFLVERPPWRSATKQNKRQTCRRNSRIFPARSRYDYGSISILKRSWALSKKKNIGHHPFKSEMPWLCQNIEIPKKLKS